MTPRPRRSQQADGRREGRHAAPAARALARAGRCAGRGRRPLDSVEVEGGVFGLLGASLVFGLVDALIGPILRLLTLPLTIITLGFFTLVVNTILLFVASGVSNALTVGGFFPTMWAAVLLTLVSTVLGWLLRPRD